MEKVCVGFYLYLGFIMIYVGLILLKYMWALKWVENKLSRLFLSLDVM